jgi:AraC-like DNA-binding protein
MHGFRDAPVAHAARRWADVVIRALHSPSDPKTIEHWARTVGASPSALRTVCAAAGWKPKAALDFARVLRAATLAEADRSWEPYNLLDISDPRTLKRFLQAAGVSHSASAPHADQIIAHYRSHIHDSAAQIILDAARSLAAQSLAERLEQRRFI